MAQLGCRVRSKPDDPVEVSTIMRGSSPKCSMPSSSRQSPCSRLRHDHPLGCHRPRVPDRICLWAMLVRLVTGCSWVDAERLVGGTVSDTTLRARRDEWIEQAESSTPWPRPWWVLVKALWRSVEDAFTKRGKGDDVELPGIPTSMSDGQLAAPSGERPPRTMRIGTVLGTLSK